MSLTIASTDLSGANYGLLVANHQPPVLAAPRVYTEELSQADGVAIQGTTYGAMTLRFDCAIKGTSASDAETKVANLVSFFQTRAGTTYSLVWDVRPTVTYTVMLTSPIAPRLGLDGALFTLEFICPSGAPD